MVTQPDGYAAVSRELLAKASEELERGDLIQASEKGWGAAAQMLKAIAQQRGWDHASYRVLFQVIDQTVRETSDPRIRDLFQIANALHTNFYEHWMTRGDVEQGLERVGELVERLEQL
jgi:hypothetical protein